MSFSGFKEGDVIAFLSPYRRDFVFYAFLGMVKDQAPAKNETSIVRLAILGDERFPSAMERRVSGMTKPHRTNRRLDPHELALVRMGCAHLIQGYDE